MRVIALQDSQMLQINTVYNANKKVVTSNADILNSVIGAGNLTNDNVEPNIPAAPAGNVNMEDAPVNLNSAPVMPGVTEQVFGSTPVPENPVSNNGFAQGTPGTNIFDTPVVETPATPVVPEPVAVPSQNIFDMNSSAAPSQPVNEQPSVPYSEPVIDQDNKTNEVASNDLITSINALRNKIDAFRDEMHSELDKIQESLTQDKTASSLVDQQTENPNLNETMVIPRDVMDQAINQGNGMTL